MALSHLSRKWQLCVRTWDEQEGKEVVSKVIRSQYQTQCRHKAYKKLTFYTIYVCKERRHETMVSNAVTEQCSLSFDLSSSSLVVMKMVIFNDQGKDGSVLCLTTIMIHFLEEFLSDTFGRLNLFIKMRKSKKKKCERKADT